MPPTLLSARELAERLDASYDEVLGWARRGIIPSLKVGKYVYFNLAQVCKALRANRQEEPEPAEVASC